MGQDLLNKSIYHVDRVGDGSGAGAPDAMMKADIRNLINECYYFGYQWKDRLDTLTNYTHSRPIYKLIISQTDYILDKIIINVAMKNFKIVSVEIFMTARNTVDFEITTSYQDNLSIVEDYMNDENNKHKISRYMFKILENDGIFTLMDTNYTILKHNAVLESIYSEGFLKSTLKVSSILQNFIYPSS